MVMFNLFVIIRSKVLKKKMGWRLITEDETNSIIKLSYLNELIFILIIIEQRYPWVLPVNGTQIFENVLTAWG